MRLEDAAQALGEVGVVLHHQHQRGAVLVIDQGAQVREVQRLVQDAGGAARHRLVHPGGQAVAGHHHDPGAGIAPADRVQAVDAVLFRHLHVDQREVERALAHTLQRVAGAVGDVHAQALGTQQLGEAVGEVDVVVDDQHPFG